MKDEPIEFEKTARFRRRLALAIAVTLLGSSPASAARGSRCHESAPACHVGAEPICICASKQASDSTCHFVCGVLG